MAEAAAHTKDKKSGQRLGNTVLPDATKSGAVAELGNTEEEVGRLGYQNAISDDTPSLEVLIWNKQVIQVQRR